MTSAPVTDWPVRILLVGIVLAAIVLVLLAMRRGWRNRIARQAHVAEPAAIPAMPGSAQLLCEPIGGLYLGTVVANDWLDRVAAHGLGTRSRVDVEVRTDGVALHRVGARDVFIPVEIIREVHRDRGIAGKAFEREALVVIRWDLEGVELESGIRPDHGADAPVLIDAITRLFDSTRPDVSGTEPTL